MKKSIYTTIRLFLLATFSIFSTTSAYALRTTGLEESREGSAQLVSALQGRTGQPRFDQAVDVVRKTVGEWAAWKPNSPTPVRLKVQPAVGSRQAFDPSDTAAYRIRTTPVMGDDGKPVEVVTVTLNPYKVTSLNALIAAVSEAYTQQSGWKPGSVVPPLAMTPETALRFDLKASFPIDFQAPFAAGLEQGRTAEAQAITARIHQAVEAISNNNFAGGARELARAIDAGGGFMNTALEIGTTVQALNDSSKRNVRLFLESETGKKLPEALKSLMHRAAAVGLEEGPQGREVLVAWPPVGPNLLVRQIGSLAASVMGVQETSHARVMLEREGFPPQTISISLDASPDDVIRQALLGLGIPEDSHQVFYAKAGSPTLSEGAATLTIALAPTSWIAKDQVMKVLWELLLNERLMRRGGSFVTAVSFQNLPFEMDHVGEPTPDHDHPAPEPAILLTEVGDILQPLPDDALFKIAPDNTGLNNTLQIVMIDPHQVQVFALDSEQGRALASKIGMEIPAGATGIAWVPSGVNFEGAMSLLTDYEAFLPAEWKQQGISVDPMTYASSGQAILEPGDVALVLKSDQYRPKKFSGLVVEVSSENDVRNFTPDRAKVLLGGLSTNGQKIVFWSLQSAQPVEGIDGQQGYAFFFTQV